MSETDRRLIRCFEAVFPGLGEQQIRSATPDGTDQWDSLGSMLLAQTIQEEFGIEADLDLMQHLGSFEDIRAYVSERVAA